MLITKNTIDTRHLFRKMGSIALFFGIIVFIMIYFSGEELSVREMLELSIIITAALFGIFYFIPLFQMKKAEGQTLKLNVGERIIKEAIVLERRTEKTANYGKLWRTSERIVFKSIKNSYVEIPLTEILEEINEKNFYSKKLKIKIKSGKSYYFEIFS